MLNFDFLKKDLGIVYLPYFVYTYFVCITLTDQTSLSDCLYFMRYWAVFVLQWFV